MESDPTMGDVPVPATPEGKAGLTALLRDPGSGLVALDYDGTLAPIVADPLTATAHPGAPEALRRLSARLGTLAVITGRPAALAVDLGGLSEVPGIVVLGHYGSERWESGVLTAPAPPAGLAMAARRTARLAGWRGCPAGYLGRGQGARHRRAHAPHPRP